MPYIGTVRREIKITMERGDVKGKLGQEGAAMGILNNEQNPGKTRS